MSKLYRFGARENGQKTFRETLTDSAVAPVHRLRSVFRNLQSAIRNE